MDAGLKLDLRGGRGEFVKISNDNLESHRLPGTLSIDDQNLVGFAN